MESFGFTNPILVQRGTNRVIAGHGRLLVAKKKGLADVPVIFLDLCDRTIRKNLEDPSRTRIP